MTWNNKYWDAPSVISDSYIGPEFCEECKLIDNCPILKHGWVGLEFDGYKYWINQIEVPFECGSRFINTAPSSNALQNNLKLTTKEDE